MKQNKLMIILLMTAILAMMIPTSAPFATANAEFNCASFPGGIINGVVVAGDLIIDSGDSCLINNSTIEGEVKADDIQNDEGPVSVTITGSTIEGNVQIKGATGDITIQLVCCP